MAWGPSGVSIPRLHPRTQSPMSLSVVSAAPTPEVPHDEVLAEAVVTRCETFKKGSATWIPMTRRLGCFGLCAFMETFENADPLAVASFKTTDAALIVTALKEKCADFLEEPDAAFLGLRTSVALPVPAPPLCAHFSATVCGVRCVVSAVCPSMSSSSWTAIVGLTRPTWTRR